MKLLYEIGVGESQVRLYFQKSGSGNIREGERGRSVVDAFALRMHGTNSCMGFIVERVFHQLHPQFHQLFSVEESAHSNLAETNFPQIYPRILHILRWCSKCWLVAGAKLRGNDALPSISLIHDRNLGTLHISPHSCII